MTTTASATLSDYDLLELVVFARKVESEGYDYADKWARGATG